MKKIVLMALALTLFLGAALGLTACNEGHKHTTDDWKTNPQALR